MRSIQICFTCREKSVCSPKLEKNFGMSGLSRNVKQKLKKVSALAGYLFISHLNQSDYSHL